MKVGPSTYTALAGMQKGINNVRKHTAELAGATQMQGRVDKNHVEANTKSAQISNEVIGTIIDVKA